MHRMLLIVAGLMLLLSIAVDPYTLYVDASDAAVHAPWWHVMLAGADAACVVGFVVWVGRLDYARAFLWLSAALIVNLLTNVVHVSRDGLSRFVAGFGAQEYLSIYLCVVTIRVIMVVWCGVLPRQHEPSA